jgi:hypothetical protein
MLLLALACTGPADTTPTQEFVGSASWVVQRGELSDEPVTMASVGVSSFEGDGYFVVSTASEDGVFELILVLEGEPAEGPATLRHLSYRKGKQHLMLTEDGACTIELAEDGVASQPWTVELSCEGLLPEEELEDPEALAWSLVEGHIEGGTLSELPARGELLSAQGYAWAIELTRQDGGGQRWGLRDSDQLVLIPWRGDSWWILAEDGVDPSTLDARFEVLAEAGSILAERVARAGAADDTDVELALLGEGELTASLDGLDHTGTELTLTLWYGLQEGEDAREVVLR